MTTRSVFSLRRIGLHALMTIGALTMVVAHAQPTSRTTTRGPVEATVTLSSTEIVIGDSVELRLEVRAADGVEVLLPEFGQSLERHPVLDFAPGEHLDDQGNLVRTQRYVLSPLVSGRHAIPPLMVEFIDRRPGQRAAPEGEDAFELLTDTLRFEVRSVLAEDVDDSLHPALGPLAAGPSALAATPGVQLGLGLAIAAGLALALWFGLRSRRERRVDPGAAATARLDALRAAGSPDEGAMDGFFVTLTDIVRRYVEDRFGLHAPELTTEEFLVSVTRSPDLGAHHQRFLRDFLQSADQVKFARHVPTPEAALAALEAALGFVRETAMTESAHG